MVLQVLRVKVDPSHVHSGVDHAAQGFHVAVRAIGSLVDCANDVSASVLRVEILEELLEFWFVILYGIVDWVTCGWNYPRLIRWNNCTSFGHPLVYRYSLCVNDRAFKDLGIGVE